MAEKEADLKDLVTFYRAAKKRYDEDKIFEEEARREVCEVTIGIMKKSFITGVE